MQSVKLLKNQFQGIDPRAGSFVVRGVAMRVPSPYIFMSHSSKNNDFTQKLTDDLQAAGFNVWVDLEALLDGDRWVREIQSAVENCHSLVVVMSRAARESEWVERETLLALDLKKPLFIARIENVPLPLQLITRQYTDFTGEYAAGLEKLITALKIALTAEAQAAPVIPPLETAFRPESEPIIHVSPDPDENNFCAYLEQMEQGKLMALIALDLHAWAKQHADSIKFSGRFTPGFHVKVKTGDDKDVTIFSLLAYMRNPGVQIPLDFLSKYPPYSDLPTRLALLQQLNALLPENERFGPERANRRPTLTLTSALDTAEELEQFKQILEQMVKRLRTGK